jgi:hypothetical protein
MASHAVDTDGEGVVRLPALVRGRLEYPPSLPVDRLRSLARSGGSDSDAVLVATRPVLDRQTLTATGDERLLVYPLPDPRRLVEPDPGAALRELLDLRFEEVRAYVAALRDRLQPADGAVASAMAATSPLDARATRVFTAQLARLLDPDALAEAVDRDLAFGGVAGRRYLDGWVEVDGRVFRGATARMSERMHGAAEPPPRPRVRAVPTRQLHITAGNSPLVPVVSTLWTLATKGAAVVKSPHDAPFGTSLLATAMAEVDQNHPLTRHISLAYWRGGDVRVEDVLLAEGAFDRRVVWGSAETVASLARRAGTTKTVLMGPRAAVSLIGRDSLGDPYGAAVRAAADSLVANQAACNASLVHYVEGSEADALAYCEELRGVLAAWDRELPHAVPRETAAALRRLQRGAFAHGTWFENGAWPFLTSVVVYLPTGFELASHPAGRCVVVRRVDALRDVLPALGPEIAAVGVLPEPARLALLDEVVARGVDGVLPLGEAERAYPGMPHDGMRVLDELVRWVNA